MGYIRGPAFGLATLGLTAALVGSAPGARASGEGAVISRGDWCAVFPPIAPVYLTTTDTYTTVAPTGTAALVCRFRLPDGTAPQREVTVEGFLCSVSAGGVTVDSRAVLTPAGALLLTCRVNPSTPPPPPPPPGD